ncbi:MAG: Beta-alanine--pyruvate aminotransferase [Alphaproteobacteria bacterium MarineAlpha2_Bin1]|nr:MAG: Beta-alanine--pyruvate aminotransferase [Alphaproteobacteria bacterium MarineAlpha2_Bin1]|tara:strand:+ start:271 stop:1605 length:1335 start_codon:yes stop_codon:yes gene_type:complete
MIKNAMDIKTNNLESYWMPFTSNRSFKANPRMLVAAKGMYYTSHDNRKILDGVAGLWCVNAGHCRTKIVEAVQDQVSKMDYSMAFQMGHPSEFEFAARLSALMPNDLNHVFFANSGSEAVDTALKIAIAYQRIIGQASRTRLVGREKGYHGVGFGGISVGGMVNNRKFFGPLLAGVDHLPATYNIEKNAFSKGQPNWGVHWADDLEKIVSLHDASTVAAVIVEPVSGSAGVIVPPVGYLKRLREICDKHGILLIFDEVITGFGRLGKPFAAEYFEVVPDMITSAKGLTNGTVPMSAVFVKSEIYDAFMQGSGEGAIELFHGYTYSGHPLACAAGLATLDVYKEDGLFERALSLSDYWENVAHSLKGFPYVKDIRNLGLIAGIELESRKDKPGARANDVFAHCYDEGILVRVTGDTIALSPPLIIEKNEINRLFETIGEVLKKVE